ncbi:MAG: ATP phosphoribosyltransferase regulatory subunit [Firmicutes bacterium]|nr:ATP phosphoribosyltransferase regulatory subunit [Alicyclobacillaceae bacterium]MCL6496583.1 ATP phosphoribosyltransferase regulatory subunit [Bacillota bacterium]
MHPWLAQEAARYRATLRLIEALVEAGFSPLATDPTEADHLRLDHTRAIVERLAAYGPGHVPLPLRVFSTGPVYQQGHWADSVDVEVVEDGTVLGEPEVFALLRRLAGNRADRGEGLVLVLGHVGLLHRLCVELGLTADQAHEVRELLARGKVAAAADCLKAADPLSGQWLRPLDRAGFWDVVVSRLRTWPPTVVDPILAALEAAAGIGLETRWDLSLTGSWPYYTGVVFNLYRRGQGQALVKGGRFHVQEGARAFHGVGFTLWLDPWLQGAPASSV